MEPEKTGHPGVAAVLSFVFNGLGQIYNGQISKGLWIIFISAISMLALMIATVLIGFWLFGRIVFAQQLILGIVLFLFSLISICVIGIYSITDAFRVATKKCV